MRFPRARLLALLLALPACGRFGFELQASGRDHDVTPDLRDAASDTAPDGASDGAPSDAQVDGQASSPTDGGADSSTDDAMVGVLDVACSIPSMPNAPMPVHRYTFDGTGSALDDVVGNADGTVAGGAVLSAGTLTLDGVDDFVDLPNGLISGLASTTIMLWVEWGSGPQRQALFDFGSSNQGEGLAGTRTSGVSVLASAPGSGLKAQLTMPNLDASASSFSTLTLASVHQLVVEILPSSGSLRLYMDGVELATSAGNTFSLADIVDNNVWIGRGQNSGDTFFRGTLHEMRIYDRVLGDCAVLAAYRAGPDTISFARCAQPEPSCAFTAYGELGAWACPAMQTWPVAGGLCAAAGMHLVNVSDSNENDALRQAMSSSSMWTGYNDITQDGSFVWCGGGSTFSAFADGEPSTANAADCVQRAAGASTWRAFDCASGAPFACEP